MRTLGAGSSTRVRSKGVTSSGPQDRTSALALVLDYQQPDAAGRDVAAL